jgi:MFS family permease
MFSTPDSSSSTTTPNGRTEIPAAWDEKAVTPDSLSPEPPAPTRSTFASVCIVAACTSCLMMSIALGASVSILLPYTGKDLHIPKENLQWILNAYSISSVSTCNGIVRKSSPLPFSQACFLLLCGRLADLYGRRRVWLAGYFILAVFSLGAGFAQCMCSSVLVCVNV